MKPPLVNVGDLKFGFDQKKSPRHCPDCKSKLGPVQYGRESYSERAEHYQRRCTCGVRMIWSFPGVWKRQHDLPLWHRYRIS